MTHTYGRVSYCVDAPAINGKKKKEEEEEEEKFVQHGWILPEVTSVKHGDADNHALLVDAVKTSNCLFC
ncbi:hypothetical protein DPMN_180588 [Dreissena polymorpha]|uniref:Uncharacterized protein n=1 Tax=Dreissena polymorpha TaxID=45954 RepID=A0A9D4EEG3_DREPO|nr:hypothetical protein DPMN_180588 [Dreissena polymorpha]